MDGDAILLMLVGMVITWSGLAAVIGRAVKFERMRRRNGG
jgi:hypothetical protein